MLLRKSATLAALTVFLTTGTALANDYNSGIVTKGSGGEFTEVEFGSGWYLKGTLGYSFDNSTDVTFSRPARSGDANASNSNTYSLSGGFGYIFNDNLRSDVTFDIFGDRAWEGGVSSGCGVDATGVAFTGDCSSDDSGSFDARAVNLNGYLSLGDFGQFSPYVGAGLGVAHVEYDGTTSRLSCTVDPGETCDLGSHSGGSTNPETFTATETFAGGSFVSLTYNLSAGVEVQLDDKWTADLNYRYTNIDNGETFRGVTNPGNSVNFDGVEIHEIRAGFRYDVW